MLCYLNELTLVEFAQHIPKMWVRVVAVQSGIAVVRNYSEQRLYSVPD
jgi:hypothetical protein